MEALTRLNIPQKLLNIIKAMYGNPRFKVRHGPHESKWKKQEAGIRQGCPLSPYLFVLLMHVMFADIKTKINDPFHRKKIMNMDLQELLYADDTLIIAKNTATANEYLRYIVEESSYYNMQLNNDKCCYVAYNKNNRITFPDGAPMKKKQQCHVSRHEH